MKFLACHKIPERSFYFRGKQFPVCARCTGVFIGQFLMILLLIIGLRINLLYSCLLLVPLFIDWFIQYLEWKESTNIRRFITGFLGGFGLTNIYYLIILEIISIFQYWII